MNKLEIKNYIDITKEWLNNAKPNNNPVKEQLYFDYKNKRYYVDNKNVVLDYSKKDLEIVKQLINALGGEIYMLPRINKPEGIKTPDYLWNNEYWDLKEIKQNAKSKIRAIDNILKTTKLQSNNFILDVTKCKLDIDNILEQVKKIYSTKNRGWIDKILILDNNKLVKVYKRKKRLTPSPKNKTEWDQSLYNKIIIYFLFYVKYILLYSFCFIIHNGQNKRNTYHNWF